MKNPNQTQKGNQNQTFVPPPLKRTKNTRNIHDIGRKDTPDISPSVSSGTPSITNTPSPQTPQKLGIGSLLRLVSATTTPKKKTVLEVFESTPALQKLLKERKYEEVLREVYSQTNIDNPDIPTILAKQISQACLVIREKDVGNLISKSTLKSPFTTLTNAAEHYRNLAAKNYLILESSNQQYDYDFYKEGAELFKKSRDYKHAIEWYNKASDQAFICGQQMDALFSIIGIYDTLKDHSKIIETSKTLLSILPTQDSLFHLKLANSYEKEGNLDKANEHYIKATTATLPSANIPQTVKQVVDELLRLQEKYPSNIEFLYKYCTDNKELFINNNKSNPINTIQLVEFYKSFAEACEARIKHGKANAPYDQLLKNVGYFYLQAYTASKDTDIPAHKKVFFLEKLGDISQELRHYSGNYSVEDSYNKALSLNPTNPRILLKLAKYYQGQSNAEHAKSHYERAIKSPTISETKFITAVEELEKLTPTPLHRGYLYSHAAQKMAQFHNTELSKKYGKNAISVFQTYFESAEIKPYWHLKLAALYGRIGNYGEALTHFELGKSADTKKIGDEAEKFINSHIERYTKNFVDKTITDFVRQFNIHTSLKEHSPNNDFARYILTQITRPDFDIQNLDLEAILDGKPIKDFPHIKTSLEAGLINYLPENLGQGTDWTSEYKKHLPSVLKEIETLHSMCTKKKFINSHLQEVFNIDSDRCPTVETGVSKALEELTSSWKTRITPSSHTLQTPSSQWTDRKVCTQLTPSYFSHI